ACANLSSVSMRCVSGSRPFTSRYFADSLTAAFTNAPRSSSSAAAFRSVSSVMYVFLIQSAVGWRPERGRDSASIFSPKAFTSAGVGVFAAAAGGAAAISKRVTSMAAPLRPAQGGVETEAFDAVLSTLHARCTYAREREGEEGGGSKAQNLRRRARAERR